MTLLATPSQMLLAFLCVLLLGAIGYEAEASLPRVQVPVGKTASRPIATAALPVFQPPPSESFDEINVRPIFDRARAPIAAESSTDFAPSLGSSASPPAIALLGIIIDGPKRIAMVRAASSPTSVGVSIGDSIGGWRVAEIDADKIVLHSGTDNTEIRLSQSRPASAGGPAPPSAGIGGTSAIATPGAVPDTNVQAPPPPDRTPH